MIGRRVRARLGGRTRSRRSPATSCVERRLGARPPVLGRPVGARQVARHVLPGRPALVPRERGRRIRRRSRSARSLNGETMQDSNTANMIFGVAEIDRVRHRRRSRWSRETSSRPALRPASARSAIRRSGSEPGDEVTIEIEGVGALDEPRARSGIRRSDGVLPGREVDDQGRRARRRSSGRCGR